MSTTNIAYTIKNDGLSFTVCGVSEDPITQEHLRTGQFYELEPLRRLSKLLTKIKHDKSDGYIIDAGANIGNHTLYLAGLHPEINIYSFEMNPVAFNFLSSNVKSSFLNNVTIFNKGLSSKKGTCGIKQNLGNPLGGAQLDFSNSCESEVSLISLDDWVHEYNPLGKCIFIKMDVEGHELEVLNGAVKLIARNRPMIYAELKDIPLFQKVSNYLLENGYVIAYAEKGALPNFLFVHQDEMGDLFTGAELKEIKHELCFRVVETWQLHRKIKTLAAAEQK